MSNSLKEEQLCIPMLKAYGSNWLTYKDRVEWAVEAKGLISYLNEKMLMPMNPQDGRSPGWTPTPEERAQIDAYPEKLAS